MTKQCSSFDLPADVGLDAAADSPAELLEALAEGLARHGMEIGQLVDAERAGFFNDDSVHLFISLADTGPRSGKRGSSFHACDSDDLRQFFRFDLEEAHEFLR